MRVRDVSGNDFAVPARWELDDRLEVEEEPRSGATKMIVLDYPDNEQEEAAYAYLELVHEHFVCGWKVHEEACVRLCNAFGFEDWNQWRVTRQ
jgi:hypothetical protein